jgi:hypothetical protein
MKQTIWIKHQRSDRNIILITNEGMLDGVNYWQGLDDCNELFTDYNRIDERLTTYVLPQLFKKYDTHCILPHPEYDGMIETIDDIIWDYIDRDNETIALHSINQWLYKWRMYPMKKSDNALRLFPCDYDEKDVIHLNEITIWPFEDISQADKERLRGDHGNTNTNYYSVQASRIEGLMKAKNETPIVLSIPDSQTKLIRNALTQYLADMERLVKCPTQSQAYEMFDLQQLAALMNYDVKVTLSADQARTFAAINGIDLPQYN